LDNTKTRKRSSFTLGIVVAVVGIILIIAGGGYALYRRYVVGHTSLSRLAVNPLVDALGIAGLILLILGVALYYRKKSPKTPAPATTKPKESTGTEQE
jgi:hypothetical protein